MGAPTAQCQQQCTRRIRWRRRLRSRTTGRRSRATESLSPPRDMAQLLPLAHGALIESGGAMRIAKLGELAAIAFVATICFCYAVMARAHTRVDCAGAS